MRSAKVNWSSICEELEEQGDEAIIVVAANAGDYASDVLCKNGMLRWAGLSESRKSRCPTRLRRWEYTVEERTTRHGASSALWPMTK